MPTQLRGSSTDSQTLRILESPGSHCIEEEPEASLELTKGGNLYFVIQELNFKR